MPRQTTILRSHVGIKFNKSSFRRPTDNYIVTSPGMVHEQQQHRRQQQQLITSEPNDELPLNTVSPRNVQKPEDILANLGARHRQLMMAIVSCSFVWCFGALSIMSSAFTTIDCGNCTDSMQTIVSEFDLRGDRSHLTEWSTSFFMVGNMIGGSTLSCAADRFGRRPLLLICLSFQAVFAFLSSLSTSVGTFAICRLLQGACYTGSNLVAWVAAYEHTHTDFRWFTTFSFGVTWLIGYSMTALFAYISSTWRTMLVWGAASTFIFTLWCWRFAPETLHFLVSKRRAKGIHKWLIGIDYSPPHHTVVDDLLQTQNNNCSSSEKTSFFHEIRVHKIFIVYCLVQLYLWTCDNFIYFGLSLYSTRLAGNTYVNYLLMGAVEMPAYVLSPIFLEKYGTKLVVSGTHLLASICFLLPAFSAADSWLSLFCWLLGKFSISCSFMSLFVYASEVFPTTIRNVSVGLCSVLSRGGAIAAPYISLLGSIWPKSPMFLLASIALAASLLTCLLPETHKKPLPVSLRQTTAQSPDLQVS
ncbi:hypothetical protein KIN20_001763 [Parelaphostrongylus tenuis]|uniref:Major facilitator superfamily (MFS) profile domain-containing protein n=1 Tax=Parelaphostrongylus tenuis TaxID=148309 RepID=A0AAD5MD85_PARTN|nr:hypothetical protein KIN20_001763 [Parelaphostrongylus tenuis]